MRWAVSFTNAARKGSRKLPAKARDAMELLAAELEVGGPVQTGWPHYGKIAGYPYCHHCHILRGRPTYVAAWCELGAGMIEVVYVGSHEDAHYGRACKS